MNVIAWLDFELAYYDITVHHVSTETLPLYNDVQIIVFKKKYMKLYNWRKIFFIKNTLIYNHLQMIIISSLKP